MIETAFILGFFTAMGWWSAGKVTKQVDKLIDPPAIVEKQEKQKEEENGRRN